MVTRKGMSEHLETAGQLHERCERLGYSAAFVAIPSRVRRFAYRLIGRAVPDFEPARARGFLILDLSDDYERRIFEQGLQQLERRGDAYPH